MKNKDLNNLLGSSGKDISFITVWEVLPPADPLSQSEDAAATVKFLTKGSFYINWGDDTPVEKVKGKQSGFNQLSHHYDKCGKYTVDISNSITMFSTEDHLSAERNTPEKLIKVEQWGNVQWESMEGMFASAENLVTIATGPPDLSKVKNMDNMFLYCHKFNSPIQHWDFSAVESMDYFLYGATAFVQDLKKLQVNPVINTNELFSLGQSLTDYNKKKKKRRLKHLKKQIRALPRTKP